jgi:two-component system, sensor histidine kinase
MGLLFSKHNSTPECIILYNTSGTIKYINQSGLDMLKYPTGKSPKTIFELMPPDQVSNHIHRLRNGSRSTMYRKDIQTICYDKSCIFTNISIIQGLLWNTLVISEINHKLHEYTTFFNVANHGMFIARVDGIIINCNDAFASYIEYEPKDLIGKNFIDLVYHKDVEKTKRAVLNINSSKKLINFSNRYLSKSGSVITFMWNVVQYNEIYYGAVENITEKIKVSNELYKSQEFLKEIEELAHIGSWEWNISTGELEWSDGLMAIYELDSDEVSYENYLKCNHPDDAQMIKNTIQKCLEDKQKYSYKHRVITSKTKTVKWINATGKIIVKNDIEYLIGVAQDITYQHAIQEDYRLKKEQAEESSRVKSNFVSSVSHEIRTPLNGIIGMVSLLNNTSLNKQQKDYMKILDSSCGVLLSIINNILDFSKIETGKISLDMTFFNASRSFMTTVDLFKIPAIQKNIELHDTYNIKKDKIYTDETKIKQIISNILNNSIKFTPEHGCIYVSISTDEKCLSISVKDTGIGISQEFLKNIYTPFSQEDAGITRKYGGSGLGLSIVMSYVKLLEGEINIESTLGEGTETSIKIPISSIADSESSSIIIIEDNYANQFILNEMLKNMTSYNVITYNNGRLAVDAISDNPAMIFMDIHMPEMDGHTTTKLLRKKGIICPIIALTANSMRGEKIKCLESGMDEYLIKPVSMDQISNVIKKYLR